MKKEIPVTNTATWAPRRLSMYDGKSTSSIAIDSSVFRVSVGNCVSKISFHLSVASLISLGKPKI